MRTRKTAAAFAFLMSVGFAAEALAGSATGPSERYQQEVRRNQNRLPPQMNAVAQRDNRQDNRGQRSQNRQEERQENRPQRTQQPPQIGTTAPAERQDRRSDRQDFRQDRREDGRQFQQERRQDRRDYRADPTPNPQDFRQDRRDDRQDYRQDRRGDRQEYRTDRRDSRQDYRQDSRHQQWSSNHNWSSYRRPTYRNDRDWRDWQGVRRGYHYAPGYGYYRPPSQYYGHRWNRGQRLPSFYHSYRVTDPYYYDLPNAPYGHQYVHSGGDIILVALATGVILDVFFDVF